MVFASFVPEKKRTIGSTVDDKKSSGTGLVGKVGSGSALNNFLSGLGGSSLNLAVRKRDVTVVVIRRRDLVQKLEKHSKLYKKFTLLKHISIEANFNLHPLFKVYPDNVPIINTQWSFPDSSTQYYSQNADLLKTTNSLVNKDEFWSLHENKGNITQSERHSNFVKALYLKWQQALFSVMDMLTSSQISSFYILGESVSLDAMDCSSLRYFEGQPVEHLQVVVSIHAC